MPEVIGVVEKKTEEKSGETQKGPWTLMSIMLGARKYSWFTGQIGPGEALLRTGAHVKIIYTDNESTYTDPKTGEQKPTTYHNITGVEPAPADASPSVSTATPNGDDRWPRRDEMSARQTACNCVATMTAARSGSAILTSAAPTFYDEVEAIAHYIITGERPAPSTPQTPSPTLAKADAQFDHPLEIDGRVKVPASLIDLGKVTGFAPAHLQNAIKLAYPDRPYQALTVAEKMDVMRRCSLNHWITATGMTPGQAKSCLGFTFKGDAETPMSAWELTAEQVSFLYDAHKGKSDTEWADWFAVLAAWEWAAKQ